MGVVRSCGFAVLQLAISVLLSQAGMSQVEIQQPHVLKIFTPGSSHYYTPVAPGMIDIGSPGGPHIYDFSAISLGALEVSYNFEVSTIPLLAPRFPAGCITMGDSPTTIENNPVFMINSDTMFVVGEATISPEFRFSQNAPWEIVAVFPATYGATVVQTIEMRETTYTSQGQIQSVDVSSSEEYTQVDGYGILRLSNGDYECIRVRKEHRGYGDKEFMYLTRDGVFLGVGGVALTDPDSGRLAGGVQIMLAPEVVSVNDPEEAPRSFSLGQNYPNPFNPATTIEAMLPSADLVTLTVYNLLGEEIATLVNGLRPAGTFTATWDASGLPSGVYFYRLTFGEFVQTKKMVLMR